MEKAFPLFTDGVFDTTGSASGLLGGGAGHRGQSAENSVTFLLYTRSTTDSAAQPR